MCKQSNGYRFESYMSHHYAVVLKWLKRAVAKLLGGESRAKVRILPTAPKKKNIINLLTFTNEYVIVISSSELNKKTSLGSSTVESNKVCLRCGFNSHLRANKEVWTKLLHLIIGSEKIIINY